MRFYNFWLRLYVKGNRSKLNLKVVNVVNVTVVKRAI
jgi:hypothetical protein